MSPYADPERAAEYRRSYYRTYRWSKAIHAAKYASRRAAHYGVRDDQIHWSVFARLHALPCAYCGSAPSGYADHIIPMHQGGPNAVENLGPACRACNESKGGRTPEQWARGIIGRRRRMPATHCRRGHDKAGQSRCRTCHADAERHRRAAQRQAVSA